MRLRNRSVQSSTLFSTGSFPLATITEEHDNPDPSAVVQQFYQQIQREAVKAPKPDPYRAEELIIQCVSTLHQQDTAHVHNNDQENTPVRVDLSALYSQLLQTWRIYAKRCVSSSGPTTKNKTSVAQAAAQRSQDILKYMFALEKQQSQEQPKPSVSFEITARPSVVHYLSVLKSWLACSQLGIEEAPVQAESLLKDLEQRYSTRDITVEEKQQCLQCYNSVLQSWCALARTSAVRTSQQTGRRTSSDEKENHEQKTFDAVQAAENLLKRMMGSSSSGDSYGCQALCKPNAQSYLVVLDTLASLENSSMDISNRWMGRADKIIRDILDVASPSANGHSDRSDFNTVPVPTTKCFHAVLKGWADASSIKGKVRQVDERAPPARAEDILRLQSNLYKDHGQCRPDVTSFSYVISSWANFAATATNSRIAQDAAERAEAILLYMEQLQESQSNMYKHLIPTVSCYNEVLLAWSKSGSKTNKSTRAEQLLYHMMGFEPHEGLTDMKTKASADLVQISSCRCCPNIATFANVLTAIANSRDRNAPERAETMLNNMEHWASQCCPEKPHVIPNTVCFNAVLDAWAKSSVRGAAQRAEQILTRMRDLYNEQRQSAKEGRELFVQPDIFSYSIVLNAWANSKERGAAKRAEDILRHMQALQDDLIKPKLIAYTTVISAWARSGEKDSAQSVEALLNEMEKMYTQGDTVAYNAVIDAYARSRDPRSAFKAEEILKRMIKRGVALDVVSFNSVINAWSKCKDEQAAQRAENLIWTMEQEHGLDPDTISCNSCINAWANVGAPERAEAMFDHMLELGLVPDRITFTGIMSAWARSSARGAAQRCEDILRRMQELYREGKNTKPDSFTYTVVCNAWSRSSEKDAADRAIAILDYMKELYKEGDKGAKPNVVTYTACISACARAKGSEEERRQAFNKALVLFEEMFSSSESIADVRPNSITYATMLRACTNLLPASNDERIRNAASIFKICCDEGELSDMVLKSLQRAVPSDMYHRLTLRNDTDASRRWSRNVNV